MKAKYVPMKLKSRYNNIMYNGFIKYMNTRKIILISQIYE